MVLTEIKGEGKITLQVEGRIDSLTMPELQSRILLCLQKQPNLVLDFAKVEYISSAGLRALLMGHKTALAKGGSMVLVNVGKIVMDVLTMTGFDKIITVRS